MGGGGGFSCADPASSRRYREALDFALEKRNEISEVQRWKAVEAQLRAVDAQFGAHRYARVPITAVKAPRPAFDNTSTTTGLHNVGMGGAFKSVDSPHRRDKKGGTKGKSGGSSALVSRVNSSAAAALDPFALSAQGTPRGAPKKQRAGLGDTAKKEAALTAMKRHILEEEKPQATSMADSSVQSPGRSYTTDSAPSSPMATSEQSPTYKRTASSQSSSSSSSSPDTAKTHFRRSSKRTPSSSMPSASSSSIYD